MPYRLAIFDFDGVLADSFPWFTSVLDETARRHGLRLVDDVEREALRSAPSREILKRLKVPLWKVPAIARDMRARKLAVAHEIPLFEGAGEALRRLAERGVRLAVVSSDTEPSVRRTLGPDLAGLIGRYDCGAALFGKAGRFRRVLRAEGVAARDAICIGDEDRDARAAAKAGVAFGAVSWGFARLEALTVHRPAEVFTAVPDLVRIAG